LRKHSLHCISTSFTLYFTKHYTTALPLTNTRNLTALRNKAFGAALDFAWSAAGTGDYAIRESLSRVKTFKNFKEAHTLRPPVAAADALFGGACLGVRGSDSVVFFDWDEGVMVCIYP
jgi:Coatomer WD associated region